MGEFGKKYTFYSRTHAVNFQAVKSQSNFSTVNIEITNLAAGKPQWNAKTTLQLSEIDLYKCFFQISNNRPVKLKSEHHGPNRNKSITLVESDGGCKVNLVNKGEASFFQCSQGQWFYAKLLIVEQLLGHGLSMAEAHNLLPVMKETQQKKL